MLDNDIDSNDSLKPESSRQNDSDIATMSLVRKMLDNFLASNDEDLAHELVKWMEWKMSGLNLTAEHGQQAQNTLNGNCSRSGSVEKLNEYTSTSGTMDSVRPESRPAAEENASMDATFATIPLNTVQRLSCKCGNSFLLRLSITKCSSQVDDSPIRMDDSSDACDEQDGYEINHCNTAHRDSSMDGTAHFDNLMKVDGEKTIDYGEPRRSEDNVCVGTESSARGGRLNKRKPVNPCRFNHLKNGNHRSPPKIPGSNSVKIEPLVERSRIMAQPLNIPPFIPKGELERNECLGGEIRCNSAEECRQPTLSRCGYNGYNGTVCSCKDDMGDIRNGINCIGSSRYSADSNVSFDKASNAALALVVSPSGNGFAGQAVGSQIGNFPHFNRYESDSSSPGLSDSPTEVVHQYDLRSMSPSKITKFGLRKLSESAVEFIGNDGKRTFRCPICLNNYANRSGLNRHYVTHSPDDLWKAECHICGKKYSRKDSLKHHIKTQHTTNMHSSGGGTRSAHMEGAIKPYPAKIAKLDDCEAPDDCSREPLNGDNEPGQVFVRDDHSPAGRINPMLSGCFSKEVVFTQMGSRHSPRTESH